MGTIGSPGFPFQDVVLVADVLTGTAVAAGYRFQRDLEKVTPVTLNEILDALSELGLRTHHYSHPRDLADHAVRHSRDIVLSIYGGETSRNRMALVPAICETFGLRYVGPDVYGRIVCQDKEISKRLAQEAGVRVVPHRILRSISDLAAIADFPTPFVVKPLWEGSSIGIGQENLARTSADGIAVARRLLEAFQAPIMIEAFVPGAEVSYNIIQGRQSSLTGFTETIIPGQPNFFSHNLFDAKEKQENIWRHDNRLIDELLNKDDQIYLNRLIKLVGGIGYGRIDGKLHDGRFFFLEITPDAWLGKGGAFASAFLYKGLSYPEIVKAILLSDRASHLSLPTNG
jgi:D-alanine-D-alanine ligase